MQKYQWLLMVVASNGRYEKTIELPFVPQVGMTIYRGGTQLMWGGRYSDIYYNAPPITNVGYSIDEEQFEVEIAVNHDLDLDSTFWDRFIPL
jgi:hypothetical protein